MAHMASAVKIIINRKSTLSYSQSTCEVKTSVMALRQTNKQTKKQTQRGLNALAEFFHHIEIPLKETL